MARLKDIYNSEIKEAMQKKFNYKNVNEIPKLEKIVINMGVGEAKENSKVLDSAVRDFRDHYRTACCNNKGKKVRCELQDQRGTGNWM